MEDNIIPFPAEEYDLEEMPIEDMTPAQLREYLSGLENVLSDMDKREPKNISSPAYDEWAEEHEDLEDLMDELRDRLDELEGKL